MDGEEHPTIFLDILYYWLAILPVLSALLVWLYFWRQRQLLKKMSAQISARLPSSFDSSLASSSSANLSADFFAAATACDCDDKPVSYVEFSRNKDRFVRVDDVVPPPSYTEAIKKISLSSKSITIPMPIVVPPPPIYEAEDRLCCVCVHEGKS